MSDSNIINEDAGPGDIVFRVGRNTSFQEKRQQMPDGSFRFFLPDGREVLTISPAGDFLVYGHLVTNDLVVYETFRAIMECARMENAAQGAVVNAFRPESGDV